MTDRLTISFGTELTRIVPGRVSTEVDADLSFDVAGAIAKARAIIAAYAERGVPRERILIKLASTWEGAQAAATLQRDGVDCNMTLLFSLAQAVAAADAGAFLISPFVGRIFDWHVKAGGGPYTGETDPGVTSVRSIYAYYKTYGIKTVVMGASFRNVGEIEALAGCDRLTIAPDLLHKLADDNGALARRLSPQAAGPAPAKIALDEKRFRWLLNEDAMATEKLAEGVPRLRPRSQRAARPRGAAAGDGCLTTPSCRSSPPRGACQRQRRSTVRKPLGRSRPRNRPLPCLCPAPSSICAAIPQADLARPASRVRSGGRVRPADTIRRGSTGKDAAVSLPDFTMRQLLEAGAHFGHQTHRWNPKMAPYIFGARNNIHIIDLAQTVPLLHQALKAVRDTVAKGGRVLFVGTKRQAAEADRRRRQALRPVLRQLPLARRHADQLEDHLRLDRAPAQARRACSAKAPRA